LEKRKWTILCWVSGFKNQGEEMTRKSWRVNNEHNLYADLNSDMLKRLVPDAPRQGPPWVALQLFQGLILTRRIGIRERAWRNKKVLIVLRNFWHIIHNSKSYDISWLRIANLLLHRLLQSLIFLSEFFKISQWNSFSYWLIVEKKAFCNKYDGWLY